MADVVSTLSEGLSSLGDRL